MCVNGLTFQPWGSVTGHLPMGLPVECKRGAKDVGCPAPTAEPGEIAAGAGKQSLTVS